MSDQKIKVSIGLTSRVVSLLEAEAQRLQISFGDMARRIMDKWADERETAIKVPAQPILVLDREKGAVRQAR